MTHRLLPLTASLLAAALVFALGAPHLLAQTIRPGSSARGGAAQGGATRNLSAGSRGGTGARQYRSNTELGDAVIQIDPETRSLVIMTDDETHEELMKVIEELDQPKPQVLIKVVFIEVTYNKGSDIGVEGTYNFNLSDGSGATTGSTTTTKTTTANTDAGAIATEIGTKTNVGNVVRSTTTTQDLSSAANLASTLAGGTDFGLAAATGGAIVRVIGDDFAATLRLLETKGKVEVISRPSIMARNNQEAVIVIGSEVPFVTNSRITDTGQTINTVTYDNVGVILRVTPFITSEGSVEMIVAPEISNLTDQSVAISDNATAPVIAKRSAETVVVTPNAQTVVIGGLMETQRVESIRKVPLLGDIPLLGMAFRRTVTSDVKKELMIFLTPYIVNRPSQLERVTSDEFNRAELTQHAFTPREMDKYLDLPRLDVPSEQPRQTRPARAPASDSKTVLRATPVRRGIAVRTKPAPEPAPAASDPRRRRVNPKGSVN